MLHADLHGKIAPEATDAERREDVLTSTVFGTLFIAGAWDIVCAWLGRARPVGDARAVALTVSDAPDYWFWPRLADAKPGGVVEPDLIMQVGGIVAIVEAKYYSGMSGKGGDPATAAAIAMPLDASAVTVDQLVRQWRACGPGVQGGRCVAGLADVLQSQAPRALFYLVRRNRWLREWRDAERSAREAGDAHLYLLTWEDLDDVLAAHGGPRWVREMRDYLRRRGVASFRGFANVVVPAPTVSALANRRPPTQRRVPTWSRIVEPVRLTDIAALARRAPRFHSKGT